MFSSISSLLFSRSKIFPAKTFILGTKACFQNDKRWNTRPKNTQHSAYLITLKSHLTNETSTENGKLPLDNGSGERATRAHGKTKPTPHDNNSAPSNAHRNKGIFRSTSRTSSYFRYDASFE